MDTHAPHTPPVRERFKLLRFVLALVFACICLLLLDRVVGPLLSLGQAVGQVFVPQPAAYQPQQQGPGASPQPPLGRQVAA